jgi:DNA-binding transcriptional ArsR family regulator
MQDDEVKKQLASLRADVQALGDDLHRLRQEDVRAVYTEQIRSVLEERVQQHFASPKMRGKVCRDPAGCAIEITTFVGRALSAYKEAGMAAGMKVVRDYEIRLGREKDECPGCLDFKKTVAYEIRNYLDISIGFDRHVFPDAGWIQSDLAEVSPEAVESFLAPLSSAVRIRLMLLLRSEKMSLAEMSRSTGLVKGHLQFHLRSLIEAGLVDFDRRSKVYSLSGRGSLVLSGVTELMRKASADTSVAP